MTSIGNTTGKFVASVLKSLGLDARPAPPVKEHASISAQLKIARAYNSIGEIAQALENDLQDRGGIPDPGGYEMKVDVKAEVAAVLVVGQRFKAPEGFKIKEARPSGKVLFYGSILKGRKLNNELAGSKFSLVSQ